MPEAPVNIAIVGYGNIGRMFAGLLGRLPGMRLSAVVGRNPERAAAAAAEAGVPGFGSIGELCRQVRPDGAIVATATEHHPACLEALIRSGVPTLVEKPVADRAGQVDPLLELQRLHPTPVMVGHTLVFSGPFLKLMALLASGRLRAVGGARLHTRMDPGPGRDPLEPAADYFQPEWLYNTLLHRVALLNRLGPPEAPALSIDRRDERPGAEAFSVRLVWSGRPAIEWRVEFVRTGERDELSLPTDRGEVALGLGHNGQSLSIAGRPVPFLPGTPFEIELASFVRFIRDGIPPWEGLAEGRAAIELSERVATELLGDRQAAVRRGLLRNAGRRERVGSDPGLYPFSLGLWPDRPPEGEGPPPDLDDRLLPAPPLPAAHPEEVAFAIGLKPVLYLSLPAGEADSLAARYRGQGCAVERLDGLLARDRLQDVRSRDRDDGQAWSDLFIARERKPAERAAEIYRGGAVSDHVPEMGRLMGYPDCCAAWFARLPDRGNNSFLRFASLESTRPGGPLPWPLNNLYLSLIPFYPCSYRCRAALGYAVRLLSELPDRAALEMYLRRPVFYADDSRMAVLDGAEGVVGGWRYRRLLLPEGPVRRSPEEAAGFVRLFAGLLPQPGRIEAGRERIVFQATDRRPVAGGRCLVPGLPAVFDFTGGEGTDG